MAVASGGPQRRCTRSNSISRRGSGGSDKCCCRRRVCRVERVRARGKRPVSTMAARRGRTLSMGPLIRLALAFGLLLVSLNSTVSADIGEPTSISTHANASTQVTFARAPVKREVFPNLTPEQVLQQMKMHSFDEGSMRTLRKLIRQEPEKHVRFDEVVYLYGEFDARLQRDKMNVNYQEKSILDPGTKFVVASNKTVILVSRKVNKYYYWEVSSSHLSLDRDYFQAGF